MKKGTNEDIIMRFLLQKFQNGKTNTVTIDKKDLLTLNIPEKDIIRSLYVLQEDGMFNITRKSNNNDFDVFWQIALKSDGIHYFEIKKEKQNKKCSNIIAVIAAVISAIMAIITVA